MTLDRLDGLNVACTRLIALAGLAALLIIAIATLADVGARWLADAPIAGVYDLSTLFIASRQNIKVTFLADRLPRRAQLACDLFAEIMTLVFFTLLAWQLVVYTRELIDSGETSFILEVGIAPWWVAATALFMLCVPVQLVVVATALRDLATGDTHRLAAHQGEV